MLFTLKQARQLCGKTQREMSEMLDICREKYMNMEKNPDTVTIGQAKAISRITGISVNDIFFGGDSTFGRVQGVPDDSAARRAAQ